MTFQTPLSSDSDLRWSLNSTFKMFLSCSYYRSSTRDRNRGQLKFRCHVGPKTVFQDGSDRTKIFKNNHFGLVYDMIYQFLGIGGLPMCVLSYIFAWQRGSSGQPPWVRLLHSLGHCHLARLCKIYSAQRYETVNGLATNVPLHYPELNWSGCLYDLNIGIKNGWNKI